MREAFIEKVFATATLAVIQTANGIVAEYQRQGYELTLRQLYYQLVARGHIENSEKSYKRLGNAISNGRLAGLIDWDAIEDRTRALASYSSWGSPADIIRSAHRSYAIDMWLNQPTYIEVWVEKEALANVVARACAQRRVPHFSCRGYVSQSEMYVASKRLLENTSAGKDVVIIHLGDHDPSGIDMSRDIQERLELMMGEDWNAVEFQRIALNMNQIRQYSPPPNPAKMTDSRFVDYKRRYGSQSWELDALEPSVLNDLIRATIEPLIDQRAWLEDEEEESRQRQSIGDVASEWEAVQTYLDKERTGMNNDREISVGIDPFEWLEGEELDEFQRLWALDDQSEEDSDRIDELEERAKENARTANPNWRVYIRNDYV